MNTRLTVPSDSQEISICYILVRMKVLIALLCLLLAAQSAREADRVTSLKGYYDFSLEFDMYSGFLDIQASPKISTHYVFITSKNAPETDDVVVWLNGGPGCSSLLGFLTELGPQLIHQGSDSLSTEKNIHSWNNNANILFLQSPPGVGFSINNDPTYQFNDSRTALDNMLSIKEWFKLFSQYENNRFWISGESYCGMYIPLLADLLLKNQDDILSSGASLNFTGIMIGNGVMLTQLHWRRQARNAFFERHSHIGPEISALISHCQYNDADKTNLLCTMGNKLVDQMTSRINPYNSIGICYVSRVEGSRKNRFWYTPFDEEMYGDADVNGDEQPCSSDDTGPLLFFNDAEVQKQLHVPQTKWTPCSGHIGSNFKKDRTTVPLFEGFKDAGLKVLLFSGNVDAQVSYVETEEYIREMGWRVIKEKRNVKNHQGSLEGWVTQYDGLTLYIINAAGHMVPHDKPAAASRMFDWFRSKDEFADL